jgi:vancomycin resistance protein VanW
MRWVKLILPAFLRLKLRVLKIKISDFLSGRQKLLVQPNTEIASEGDTYPERITIAQKINVSRWAENKRINIRLAAAKFQNLTIRPNEIFSFWYLLGNPSRKAGYQIGINIIKSKLDYDYGGGLCQLSGLIYHLALAGGLEILERYPHSIDLYTDETRYTPLGADATTAYGYKDLRLRNNLSVPICFRIEVEDRQLRGSLCSPQKIGEHELKFEKKVFGREEEVTTLRRTEHGTFAPIAVQTYVISDHEEEI